MTLDQDEDFRPYGTELAAAWPGRAALGQQGAADSVIRRLVDEFGIGDRQCMSESAIRQVEPVLSPDQIARVHDLLVAELTALRISALEQGIDPDDADEVFLRRAKRLRSAVAGTLPQVPELPEASLPAAEPGCSAR
jgi:hypothetical protein